MTRQLRLIRPCPTPEVVRGETCDTCNKRVHDLTRSSDPAADVARLGGVVCARVLVAAVVLSGCSAAVDGLPTVTFTLTPDADAGADVQQGPQPPDDGTFVGEMISE